MSHSRVCERGRNLGKPHGMTISGSIMCSCNPNLQTYAGSGTSIETPVHVLALDGKIRIAMKTRVVDYYVLVTRVK